MTNSLTPEFVRETRDSSLDHITKLYVQFAALDQLVAAGRIKKVRGGYRIADATAYEQVALLLRGMTIPANGGHGGTVKLMTRTKKFDAIARRFGVDVPSR